MLEPIYSCVLINAQNVKTMRKAMLLFGIVFVLSLTLESCSKSCVTCVGGDLNNYEICSDDGYGRISTKAFRQDCKAGGGNPQ